VVKTDKRLGIRSLANSAFYPQRDEKREPAKRQQQRPAAGEVAVDVACVTVRSQISGTAVQTLPQSFSDLLPVAVARFSSGGVAVRYVLPVLWMTPCLPVIGQA